MEASEAIDSETPAATDILAVDATDDPQPGAHVEVPETTDEALSAMESAELMVEMPQKKRGLPSAAEKRNEQHGA